MVFAGGTGVLSRHAAINEKSLYLLAFTVYGLDSTECFLVEMGGTGVGNMVQSNDYITHDDGARTYMWMVRTDNDTDNTTDDDQSDTDNLTFTPCSGVGQSSSTAAFMLDDVGVYDNATLSNLYTCLGTQENVTESQSMSLGVLCGIIESSTDGTFWVTSRGATHSSLPASMVFPCEAASLTTSTSSSTTTSAAGTTTSSSTSSTTTSVAASCPEGKYQFYWNGDYSGDTDKACFDNGTATKDGTTAGTPSLSADYLEVNALNEYLKWAVANRDGVSEAQGTLYFTARVADDGDADLENMTFAEVYVDGNNYILFYITGSTNKFTMAHKGSGTSKTLSKTETISFDTWYRFGATWDTTTSPGRLSLSMLACSDAGSDCAVSTPVASWQATTGTLRNFVNAPDDIALGENACGLGQQETLRIKDVIITSGYQDADLLNE